jgi:diguanylate cyclase (GGDEF)-like protein/PAS domain S-box-containing protein
LKKLPAAFEQSIWLRGALLAGAYFITAQIGLTLSLMGHSVTLFWPPSGIALAALLLFGMRWWPAIFIGSFFANLTSGFSVLIVTGMATGSTLSALAGAYILRRQTQFNLSLRETRDIFNLLIRGGVLSTFVSAAIGPASMALGGVISWELYTKTLLFWWMGDALGVALFTPAILSFRLHRRMATWKTTQRRETGIFVAILAVLCVVLFAGSELDIPGSGDSPRMFLLFPIIVWAALSFNMRAVSATLLAVFGSALAGMVRHGETELTEIVDLWLDVSFLTVVGMGLSVLTYQRARAAELLREREAHLSRAQRVANMGSWELDIARDKLSWSDEACHIFGVEPGASMKMQEFINRVHPDDRLRVSQSWTSAMQGEAYDVEYRIMADNRVKWLRETAQMDFDKNGHAIRAIGAVRDITPRRRAEEERNRSQYMLRAIIDAVPVRLFWKDRESRYLGANQLFLADAGVGSVDDLIGHSDQDYFPEQAARYREVDEEVMRSGKSKLNVEEHARLADGREAWLYTSKTPLHGEDGEIIGVLGAYIDISERKQAEEGLRLAAKVFESSGEAILITDANANIISVNETFTRLTGYSAEEVMGKNPRILSSGKHDEAFYLAMWADIQTHGLWQGEIWNKHKSGRVYPKWMSINAVKDERGNVTHYISIATDISQRKQAEQDIQFLAYYDVLTGLPNRSLLRDRMEQLLLAAHRDKESFALLFLDLDRFKYVNDSMGHAVGDKLLQTVALRLQVCVREGDTVSRLGGDEFIVLLRQTDAAGAALVADKLLKALAQPYDINGIQIATHSSIGIAIYPDHADNIDTLIKNADMAMYRAKEEGRGNFQYFAPEMNSRANQLFAMEKDIRLALERGEFMLYYQPQVRLVDGAVCGVEALIRWKHPEKGFISPAEFIPVAEETGQIVPIGEWVLKTACRQLAEWRNEFGLPNFPVAVNVSTRQLRQTNLAQYVENVLTEAGLHGEDLELELTEGIMMGDTQAALDFLERMRHLGVALSIDDFGTGFSSMSYLKRLPLDKLKVDQSFVRDIETDEDDAAIVRSIISLAHRLNLRVIAEGVETQGQLDFLRVRGCDEIQGYYFSRPLPVTDLIRFIQSGPRLN